MLEQVKHLRDAGFAIHWLHPHSKRPIGNDWASKPVATLETLKKTYRDGNNVGVRLGKWSRIGGVFMHIVDVDIRKGALAGNAIRKLREMLPEFDYENCPAVLSGSGGESRHFYLFTDKPFPPRKFAHSETFEMVFDAAKGRDVKKWDWELHLLGTGAQAAIPPSIHPDTEEPYTWIRPFAAQVDDITGDTDLPIVPSAAVERLIGYEDQGEVDPERLKPIGLNRAEIRQYLSELPFEAWFEDRDGWFRTGMAIHHETNGSDAGFDLWCEFSKKSEKFSMTDSRRVWKSFKNKGSRPFRMASIVAVVKDERMEADIEDYGDDDLGDDLGEPETPTKDNGDFEDYGDPDDAPAGDFDDLLGTDAQARKVQTAAIKPSHAKLNKANVEKALGKPTPGWVKRLNDKHAVARVSGRTVVMDFMEDGGVAYGGVTDLHAFYENDRRPKDDTTVPVSKVWLQHSHRRTYPNGIVFSPNVDVEGAYNHWQGFSVETNPEASCDRFLWHLKNVFCSANEEHYEYMIKWLAHLVQKPEEKPGVAVVARGRKGAGKDTPIEYLGLAIAHHYLTIGNRDQMLGKFNSHLERCLLLHMQEGFWAGDKAAESQLKYLITSEKQMIEPKGMNAFSVRSVLRLFISSNEKWVVPASDDERRYFVLDVSDIKRRDHDYFGQLREEMNGEGPAALLHYLMNIDLSDFQVRNVPNTAALGEQKLQGLKNFDRWWFGVLEEGRIEGAQEKDDVDLPYWEGNSVQIGRLDLRENYRNWLRSRRFDGEEITESEFGRRLKEMVPQMQVGRATSGGKRPRVYVLPDLAICRKGFEAKIASDVIWPSETIDVEIEEDDDLG